MRIAILNSDTVHGPDDPRLARAGAAQLVASYLAAALAERGHQVDRLSPCPRAHVRGSVRHLPRGAQRGERYHAAIACRYVGLLDGVSAERRLVWVHDQHGHSGAGWARFPDARVVVVSECLRRWVEPHAVVHGVVPCGVPDGLFSLPVEPGRRAYTSGMWVECRGTLEAVAAFERARAGAAELSLELFGDHELWGCAPGGYTERVRERAAAVGAVARGTVSHVAMIAELPRLNILLHPATSETCGVAVLEAMAAGNPVVATGHAALKELGLHGHFRGVAAMAAELVRLATRPGHYRRVAEHNRAQARRFAWSRVAERWERVIRNP